MIQLRVASLGVDPTSQSPVVILQETGGSRVLPIWIGPAEASAIAMELAGMKFARPLTHDLLVAVIRALGGKLERVEISRLEENTYFARLLIEQGEQQVGLDARPSDSIAIALRTGSGIWADPTLLASAPTVAIDKSAAAPAPADPPADRPALSPEQLREYLRKLDPQDLGRFQP